jgi:hypothetical protein
MRWVPEILPLSDDDPLGVDDLATHHLPLIQADQRGEGVARRGEALVHVVDRPRAPG